MDDEEELVFHLPDDTLAQSAKAGDEPAFCVLDGRIDGSDEKGTGEAKALKPLAGKARPQGVQVELDVR